MKTSSYKEFYKNSIKDQVHLMTVDNNPFGRTIIDILRKQIRQSKTNQRIVLYGRGKCQFGTGWYRPVKRCSKIGVYIVTAPKEWVEKKVDISLKMM
jgi:hypothetical protein